MLDDGEEIVCDVVLLATGRESRIENLGLAKAGVSVEDGRMIFDDRCRTSAYHIYACGDVAGWHRFTHAAEHMSKVAITNAILRLPARLDSRRMVWTTFAQPELAHVGATEESLRMRGVCHQVHRFSYEHLDRAAVEGRNPGLVKLLADRRGRILGGSIVGERAGELIVEVALAMAGPGEMRTGF